MLDTPAILTTTTVTTGEDGCQEVSDRHQEANAEQLSVESVISINESPEPEKRKRGGKTTEEGEKKFKNTTSVVDLAELETNLEVQ